MSILGHFANQIINRQQANCNRFADFSKVPKENLIHYRKDRTYYSYKPNPLSDEVILYEEHIKTTTQTEEGLYPPEVVMIYFCKKTNKYPAKNGQIYPAYWWFEYGIVDIDAFLADIEKKEYIQLINGTYKPTNGGEKAIDNNEAIIWAHQTKQFGGAWNIMDELKYIPDHFKEKDWKDKVWYLYNKQIVECLDRINQGGDIWNINEAWTTYRSIVLNQAGFLEYEKKYENAIEMYQKVLTIDEEIENNEKLQCEELGMAYHPMQVAPGIIEKIKTLQEKI